MGNALGKNQVFAAGDQIGMARNNQEGYATEVSVLNRLSGPVTGNGPPLVAPPTGNRFYVDTTSTPDNLYYWDGAAWNLIGDGNTGATVAAANPPAGGPVAGTPPFYIDTSVMPNLVYYWDGAAWQPMSCNCPPTQIAGVPVIAPAANGSQFAVDTTTNPDSLYYWDGAAWNAVGGGAAAGCDCPPATGAVPPVAVPAAGTTPYYVDTSTAPQTLWYHDGANWNVVGSQGPVEGAGAPAGAPAANTSRFYVRNDSNPYEHYWWDGAAWHLLGDGAGANAPAAITEIAFPNTGAPNSTITNVTNYALAGQNNTGLVVTTTGVTVTAASAGTYLISYTVSTINAAHEIFKELFVNGAAVALLTAGNPNSAQAPSNTGTHFVQLVAGDTVSARFRQINPLAFTSTVNGSMTLLRLGA